MPLNTLGIADTMGAAPSECHAARWLKERPAHWAPAAIGHSRVAMLRTAIPHLDAGMSNVDTWLTLRWLGFTMIRCSDS